ncbi:MAG: hypothetical protein K6E19_04940 [Lachnospiraceae bacterium]|nr:hypothetical protein [Lachnospiraceae bacterium]
MKDRSDSYRYESVNGLKASNLLEYLMQGGREESTIRALTEALLDYMRKRRDCADFRAAYLIRVLFSFEHDIPKDLYDEILSELLSFPYEDCGGHDMCTWTENHRLYAAGIEFLITEKHGSARFSDGKSNDYHREHAIRSLETGLSHIIEFGFCEWGSNNYYSETMAGLANLVQFSKNPSITGKARRALYMILYDILSQTVYNEGYIYNPACARAYVDNKVSSALGNYLEAQIRGMFGENVLMFKEKEGCFLQLLSAKDEEGKPVFTVPESFLSMVKTGPKETCIRQGVDIDDYGKYGLKSYSQENVRYAMTAGAISEPRAICHTMRYL